tara:strand:+ start:373 stop:852 length:480 start_codon:yes stop_codon:yes gene_type:complete
VFEQLIFNKGLKIMVGIKVVAEKGINYSVWQSKDGNKHRVYFKTDSNDEVGNYDIKENKFFTGRGYDGTPWNIINQDDSPQALIIIGDDKKIFVGPASATNSTLPTNMNTQQRITLGMCINNATNVIVSRGTLKDSYKLVTEIYDLADNLFEEYNSRYN